MRLSRILIVALVLVLLAVLLFQIPVVKYHLGWRLDAAGAYLHGMVNPVEKAPTPLPQTNSTATPSATPTASPTPDQPTDTPVPSPTALPEAVSLPAPVWEKQDWNNCGPASLAMYLKFYGWEGDQYEISDKLKPERNDRNVNVEELDYFVRNNAGWLNIVYRVGGDINLLKTFIANGIPIMIEEGDVLDVDSWPNDDRWAGHYLLLTGYDDGSQFLIGQDTYRGADRQVTYSEIDEHWQGYNRVYIVIYHPNQEETVKTILGEQWDAGYNRQYALEVAQAETEADPGNAFAWFNIGSNLVYFEKYAEAAKAYDTARSIGLPQRMFRYQFGPFFAYFHANRMEDLMAIVDYALQITDNSEEAWLWKGWGLYRQGDTDGAIEAFRTAYSFNTQSVDALNALEFMGVEP